MTNASKIYSRTTRNSAANRPRSLRSAARLGFGLLSLLSLSVGQIAHAGTVNWDNTSGDWFANPTHWSNGAYPGAGDDAVNMSTAAITLGQSTTINSFFSNGAFSLQGGTFSGNQANSASTITVNSVFADNGGTINNFTVNQGMGGSVVFTGNGSNSISNSILNANLDLATYSNAYLDLNGAVTENGAITLGTTGSGIRLVNSGTNLTIGSTGSLNGFGSVYQYNSNTVTNNGTINANSSTNALSLGVTQFNNNGTAKATNGATLAFNSTNVANSGTISADGPGSVAALTGVITNGANSLFSATNGGQIQVNGATLLGTINTDVNTALIFNGGSNTINGEPSAVVINGNLDLAAKANAALDLDGSVTENGAINLGTTSTGIRLVDSGTLLTLSSTSNLMGFGSLYQYNNNTVTNNGIINANSKGNTLSLGVTQFNNNGTAKATNGGTLAFNSTNVANNGTISADGMGSTAALIGVITNGANSLFSATNGGQVQVNGATLLGTINTDANTALIFNGGSNTINGEPAGVVINGNLDLATNANAALDLDGSVTENGAINLGTTSNGLRLVDTNTLLTLSSTGSLSGFGTLYQYNNNTVNNNGLINANSSTNALNLGVTQFNNNGTAEATKGATLNFNNTNTNNTGTIAAKSGGIVNIIGTFTGSTGSTFDSVGGAININGATLLGTLNGTPGTSLVFNGNTNTINGEPTPGGAATINTNLDLATNTSAYLDLDGSVTENGAITLGTTSNGIRLVDTNTLLTLSSTGSLSGFGNLYQYNNNTVTNNGLIDANSKSKTLNEGLTQFNNNGTMEATNGATLTLNNTNTSAAAGSTIAATGAGSVVTLAGIFTGAGDNLITASGGGQFQVNGAQLLGTINTDANTALVFSGSSGNYINGEPAPAVINGNLDLATNANAYLDLDGSVTENGAITLGTTSNGIRLVDTNTLLTLSSTGSLSGFGNLYQYNNNTVTNNGLIDANSSTNALKLGLTQFNNNGTMEATNGATLAVNNTNTTNNGALNAVGAGSVVAITGNYTGTGSGMVTASGGGQVQVNGAQLLGTINTDANTALVFNGSSGNYINGEPAPAVINGNLDLATNANAYLDLDGSVTENGSINLGTTSNGIRLVNSGTNLIVGSSGSVNGFGSVYQYNSNTLTNNGLINANSSGNTLNLNTTAFTNTGTVQVLNGAALSVTSANTDSGNILVKNGGTATFTQGLTQTAGLTQVDGTLNSPLTLTGGTLAGTGTVNGAVTNNGGTVSAGNSASPFGTLTVSGPFSQTSGALNVGFSNASNLLTQSSLLAVSGAVLTGGVLDVSYLGSGPYTVTAPFTFLNYGSLTSSVTGTGSMTQYFSNETFDQYGNGIIDGSNGFVYDLINNANPDGTGSLQLGVVTNGAPTPAVPEASTTISFGLLLALGGMVVVVKRRRTALLVR